MKNKIELRKTSETGAEVIWLADIQDNVVAYTWGQVDGKLQTEEVEFLEGKNIGRANETTPEQQCLFEACRKARKKVEKGYRIVKGKELITEQTSDTVVTHGADVPFCMLAETLNKHLKKLDGLDSVDVQPKLDGNRCLINIDTCELYSRSRKQITSIPGLGEEVAKRCKNLVKKGVKWVDGELYSDELSFNDIQSVIRKKEAHELAGKIKFNMYDILLKKPWRERKHIMAIGTDFGGRLDEVLSTMVGANLETIEEWNQAFVAQGYEGVIVRLLDEVYENKRSRGLLKHKTFIDAEYKVIGFQAEKNRANVLGAVILVTKDGTEFNARPAVPDETKQFIWNNQKEYLGMMATVKFQELDGKSGIPRFPVLKGFRAESDIETDR